VISDATLRRLQSASGQLDGVVRMVADGRYCIDVLHQITAVQAALEHARQAVLADHVRTCVRDAYDDGRVDNILEELIDVLVDQGRHATVNCEIENR